MQPPLILASSSGYRRNLLARLGLAFSVQTPAVAETPRAGEAPAARAPRLAVEKALAVARLHPDAVVIGSDQVAALEGCVLHKPGDEDNAVAQLLAASGKQAEFFTAVAVARDGGRHCEVAVDCTRVRFRRLTAAALRDYVRREQPLDCAGAFKSEGLGIALFDAVHCEDPTALIGLPLIRLCSLLESAGIRVLEG